MLHFLRKRRVQRFFSRGEWMRRLFFLGYAEDTQEGDGLILIQIDGLARGQLERALKRRKMPFLRRLLRRHKYRLHSHYSGLPSSTPAVQGELFYGRRCAVPAWDFYRNDTGAYRSMFDQAAAQEVETMLREQGEGLLEGGSAYCDIYSGGAKTPNFCAACLGWNYMLRINPVGIALGLVLHAYVAVRLVARLLLELVLAVRDLFAGVKPGEFWTEVRFIPGRTFMSIVMRDLTALGVKMDAARGVRVIHVNFLGYDDLAHRRGPGSLYAHWTLKGIDYCISRIYRMAVISSRRRYRIWIYSDHGQEKVVPYLRYAGKPIAEAVADVLRKQGVNLERLRAAEQRRHTERGRWLRHDGEAARKRAAQAEEETQDAKKEPKITNKGPVSHVYLFAELPAALQERVARALVLEARIPMVLVRAGDAAVLHTAAGLFQLPEDTAKVFGNEHPFVQAIGQDLVRLAHHRHAGNFVLLGWQQKGPYVSFAFENGSHAGPGPRETHGFALLPEDSHLPELEKGYLRPEDLFHAAQRVLGRAEAATPPAPAPATADR
ncbi:MAG: alkaline phosphatase family protein [Candidatus Hydrogenedentes bacterium]|nr:alkaline phosphatase family protein [Candidatus Hydrogenedentota bacterium]